MKQKLLRAGFAAYALLMLWLLFFRHRGTAVTDYPAQVLEKFNLLPFSTIGYFLRRILQDPSSAVICDCIYNQGGNIAMFVPLGFFLRALVPCCRKFSRCMAAVLGIMICVELMQALTLRGFCETDDLILNLLGAAFGFWFAGTVFPKHCTNLGIGE
jgi:glycopeptide antibiotics resistance protein